MLNKIENGPKGHNIDQKRLKVYEIGWHIPPPLTENLFAKKNSGIGRHQSPHLTGKLANLTGTLRWGQKPFVLAHTIRQGDQVVVPDILHHHSSGEELIAKF